MVGYDIEDADNDNDDRIDSDSLFRYGYGGAGTVPALMAAGPGQFEDQRPL